ncbi:hypothetical protein CEXT_583521 [Caerostris extrusa]|uniref:Uncharacterized protein n=1 Tax=Caerostris extrusa TaxID=172846 RepID=A0AAV4NQA4_CAEEX|nr:hypothetical protein CEXT_583521 [Caerostris extrusa]
MSTSDAASCSTGSSGSVESVPSSSEIPAIETVRTKNYFVLIGSNCSFADRNRAFCWRSQRTPRCRRSNEGLRKLPE